MSDLLQTTLFQTAGEMRKGERNKSKNGSLVRGNVPRRHGPSQREEVLHLRAANLPALHQLTFPVGPPPPERSADKRKRWGTVQDGSNSHTHALYPAGNIDGKVHTCGHADFLLDPLKTIPYWVLLNCWWDPELVLVRLRWFFQLRLTGQRATAATWGISLFIWNSLLQTRWETDLQILTINVRPLVVGSVNETLFIFWTVISDAFFDLAVRFHGCVWNEVYPLALLLLWSLHTQL